MCLAGESAGAAAGVCLRHDAGLLVSAVSPAPLRSADLARDHSICGGEQRSILIRVGMSLCSPHLLSVCRVPFPAVREESAEQICTPSPLSCS